MQMQSIAADGLLTISLFGLSILFAEETWFLFAEDMVLIWEYEVCFFFLETLLCGRDSSSTRVLIIRLIDLKKNNNQLL